MNILKTGLRACAVFCVLSAGCSQRQGKPETIQAQQGAAANLDAARKIVAQTAQTYRAMDNPTLLKRLAEQSAKKKEPFNSLAFRELQGRKDVSSESLASMIKEKGDADALLPLLLLRRLDANAYRDVSVDLKVAILTDALRTSRTFNTWGLPNFYVEEASNALIECGRSAYPALKQMLSDTRPAPVFGSKMHMEYLRHRYRLCDYALFLIERIQGKSDFRMPPAVAERDSLIKEILK